MQSSVARCPARRGGPGLGGRHSVGAKAAIIVRRYLSLSHEIDRRSRPKSAPKQLFQPHSSQGPPQLQIKHRTSVGASRDPCIRAMLLERTIPSRSPRLERLRLGRLRTRADALHRSRPCNSAGARVQGPRERPPRAPRAPAGRWARPRRHRQKTLFSEAAQSVLNRFSRAQKR